MRLDPTTTFAEPLGLEPRPTSVEFNPRESAIAALLLEDVPADDIAAAVGLQSAAYLETYLDAIQRKVGARTRWGLALRLRELAEREAVESQ